MDGPAIDPVGEVVNPAHFGGVASRVAGDSQDVVNEQLVVVLYHLTPRDTRSAEPDKAAASGGAHGFVSHVAARRDPGV